MIVSRGALVNWLNLHDSTLSFSTLHFPPEILEELLKTSEPLTTVDLPQMWSTRILAGCKRSWRGWTRSWAPSGPLARRTMGGGCSTSQTVSTLPTYSGWSLYDFFGTAVLVDSVGWSCISDILEWFFLKKHYHGHHFPPQPPQSLPPSLISQPICKVALACYPKNTRHSCPTTCKTAFSHELQPHDSTENGSSPLQQLHKWLRTFKEISVNIQTFVIFHTF